MAEHRIAWGSLEPPPPTEGDRASTPDISAAAGVGRSVSYRSGESMNGSSNDQDRSGPTDRLRAMLQERGVLRSTPKLEGDDAQSYHTRVLRTALLSLTKAQLRFGNSRRRLPNIEFANDSLFFLPPTNPLRAFWFEMVMLVIVLGNCVSLAIYNPLTPDTSPTNAVLAVFDYVFLSLFTLEAVIRIIAMGMMLHPYSYLRDPWNVLDFVVLVLGWVSLTLTNFNLSILRALRALRATRSLRLLKELRLLVEAVLMAIPMMVNVFGVMLLLFVVAGLLGSILFGGILSHRCVTSDGVWEETTRLCSPGLGGRTCPFNYTCVRAPFNPNNGLTSFDTSLWSFFTVFNLISLEGWTTTMYITWDATNSWSILYYLVVVLAGAFILLNLWLAVIANKFEEAAAGDDDDGNDAEEDSSSTKSDELSQPAADTAGAKDSERTELSDNFLVAPGSGPRLTRLTSRTPLVRGRSRMHRPHKPSDDDELEDLAEQPEDETDKWERVRLFFDAIQERLAVLVVSEGWELAGMVMIAINCITMGINYAHQPYALEEALAYLNMAFTIVFAIENTCTIIGLTPRVFFTDLAHVFDFIVVGINIAELFLPGRGVFTALRAVRLFRIVRLIRRWKAFQAILITVRNSLTEILYLTGLLLFWLFLYSVLGVHLFAGVFGTGDSRPRQNFDNLWQSFLTVFQIVTLEDWNSIMYETVAATSMWAIIYFLSLVVSGVFIMLNLFIAIIMDKFSEDAESNRQETLGHWSRLRLESELYSDRIKRTEEEDEWLKEQEHDQQEVVENLREQGTGPQLTGDSFFVFSPTNRFRLAVAGIIFHPVVEYISLFLVLGSCVFPAMESLYAGVDLTAAIDISRYVFLAIVGCETIMRAIALGLIGHRGAYLRSVWNWLDIVVLGTMIANIATSHVAARTLQCLRPLRFASLSKRVQLALRSMAASFRGLLQLVLVLLLVWYIFAILGVQFFGGRFDGCTDTNVTLMAQCTGNFSDGERQWVNLHGYSFDNVLAAMQVLLEMSTTEGWGDVMYAGIDGTSDVSAPVRDAYPAAGLYFVSFLLVGVFLVLNLFVGVIIENFNRNKEHQEGIDVLTESQRQWLDTARYVMRESPIAMNSAPTNPVRRFCYYLVTSRAFAVAMAFFVIVNTLILLMYVADPPVWLEQTLFWSNVCFAIIFASEALLRLCGQGPRVYLSDLWNLLDLTVAVTSIADIFVNSGPSSDFLKVIRVLRIFKVARLFRGMFVLLRTLAAAVPQLLHVSVLLVVVMYMYAVVGVALFSNVPDNNSLNDQVNFRTWPLAMLILLRASTGESWNLIMRSLMAPNCENVGAMECAAAPVAMIYFLSYTVIVTHIMLKLVIAVILESMNELARTEKNAVHAATFHRFALCWARYDRWGRGYIHHKYLEQLLRRLGPPLGIAWMMTPEMAARNMSCLEIPIDKNGLIAFHSTLHVLSKRVVGVSLPRWHAEIMDVQIAKLMPPLMNELSEYTTAHHAAACWVQLVYRRRRERRRQKEAREVMLAAHSQYIDQHIRNLMYLPPMDTEEHS